MFNIKYFEKLDSTNKYIKDNLDSLNNKSVIFTTNQTNGKGRMSRSWVSTNNSLTFSFLLKDKYSINHFSTISLLTGASVYLALSQYINKHLSIKWPNDIYYKDSKICGILLESVSNGDRLKGVIVGIGVNVNNDKNELMNIDKEVTSLYLINNHKYRIETILKDILDKFEYLYNNLVNNHDRYYTIIKKHNYLKHKKAYANINNEQVLVKIKGINKDNTLKVKYNNKTHNLSTGEIVFH